MKTSILSYPTRPQISALLLLSATMLDACSGDPGTSAPGNAGGNVSPPNGGMTNAATGGAYDSSGTGGSSAAGTGGRGVVGTGGLDSVAGGGKNETTGGATNASSGGAISMGGAHSSGGGASSSGGAEGGAAAGGTKAAGGAIAQGGTVTSGGSAMGGKATGGATSKGGSASGGTATGGAATGGSTGGTPDCNSVIGQPIVTVASDGSGQYRTVQAAINSLSASNTTPTQIRLKPGTYKEKLVISRPYVTLCGEVGKAATTILTYSDNANTGDGSGGTLGTSGSASTRLSASNVSAENVTFENSTGAGIQAVALLVTGSRVQFRNCRFMGYQDTLYVSSGTQYFKSCYVQGSVDFIFGAATAVFDSCTIHNATGGTSVTAPSTDQATPYGLVFLGGELTAASSVSSGSVALGRNWRPYGAAAYIRTSLGAHVNPVGWVPMGSNTLATARFSEYLTTGPGASTANLAKRASQSKQLTASEAASYSIANLFGAWTPSFSR